MKTVEFNHNNDWRDKLLNRWPFLLEHDSIKPVLRGGVCKTVNIWHAWIAVDKGTSLFYNGAVFVRFMLPFWVGVHIRFTKEYLFQCGLGWKLNGRFGMLFRFQSDKSAEIGEHGPNYGQATGWECGPK